MWLSAIATNTLLPQYEQATRDALEKERDDLARAALHKKVAAKKEISKIKEQLQQLSDLQLNLEQNQSFIQRQLK